MKDIFIFNNRFIFGNKQSDSIVFLNEEWNPLRIYALFKVSKNSTRAIKIRRSSDNTETDIGFSGIDLDTAAILTFVGAGDGFVTRIYDQSSTPVDAWQTNAVNQPYIVQSGVLCTKNGKPALRATSGQNRWFRINGAVGVGATVETEIIVGATSTVNANAVQYMTSAIGTNPTVGIIVGGNPAYYFGLGCFWAGTYVDSNIKNTNQYIIANEVNGVSPQKRASFFVNGTVYDNNIDVANRFIQTSSIMGYSPSQPSTGVVGEFQFYMSFLNSIKADIPTLTEQLNEYYGTY